MSTAAGNGTPVLNTGHCPEDIFANIPALSCSIVAEGMIYSPDILGDKSRKPMSASYRTLKSRLV